MNKVKILASVIGLFWLNSVGFSYEWTAEDYQTEADQALLWKRKLQGSQEMPEAERIPFLRLGLKALGHRMQGRHSAEVGSVYSDIQSAMLAIPGHARYFADELERLRANPEESHPQQRYWYIRETLVHLPSPETVSVLGKLLYDERDTPPPPSPGQDWTDLPANSFLAAETLANIGLRDTPVSKKYLFGDKTDLEKFREWWEEIKSGERTFSFTGQNVEYRFKPDGTWEAIALENPPDDTPKTKESTVNERPSDKRPQADQIQKDETQGRNPWLWICGLGVVLLGLFALIGRRFKKH